MEYLVEIGTPKILFIFIILKQFFNMSVTKILTLFVKKSFLFLKHCLGYLLGGE